MVRLETVISKLTQVSDDEWRIVIAKSKRLIEFRTGGKTQYGAHSTERLGMSSFDYYFQNTVLKLYDGAWDWQFEKYTLAEQVCRIVGSMISEEVRKYKSEKKDKLLGKEVPFEEVEPWFGVNPEDEEDTLEREQQDEKLIELIEKAIEGNEDMETLFLLKMEGQDSDEICQTLSWEKRKLYKVTERMKNKVLSYQNKQQQ
jgi:hypothetical protein